MNESVAGSRWCKGHQYIGEKHVEVEDRDPRAKPSPKERRSILDAIKGLFE